MKGSCLIWRQGGKNLTDLLSVKQLSESFRLILGSSL
jgi:hypothetical protein